MDSAKARHHMIPTVIFLNLACMHAGGARVIQIGGGTRDLYYYPKDTVLVTAISPNLKKGERQAMMLSCGCCNCMLAASTTRAVHRKVLLVCL